MFLSDLEIVSAFFALGLLGFLWYVTITCRKAVKEGHGIGKYSLEDAKTGAYLGSIFAPIMTFLLLFVFLFYIPFL